MKLKKSEWLKINCVKRSLLANPPKQFTTDCPADLLPSGDLICRKYGGFGGVMLKFGWMPTDESTDKPRVVKSISSHLAHGIGGDRLQDKGQLSQYSTRYLAIKALRRHCEMIYANRLRDIDKEIELELQNPTDREVPLERT